jgi:hypothetical protein
LNLNNTKFILFPVYHCIAIHSVAYINLGTILREAVTAVST